MSQQLDQGTSSQSGPREENFSRFMHRNSITRRSGDIEGVRQSSGNWHRDADTKWRKYTLIQSLKWSEITSIKERMYVKYGSLPIIDL